MNKELRISLRVSDKERKMIDYIKSLHSDITDLSDSEVCRMAIRELAEDRGFKEDE